MLAGTGGGAIVVEAVCSRMLRFAVDDGPLVGAASVFAMVGGTVVGSFEFSSRIVGRGSIGSGNLCQSNFVRP